MDNIKKIIIVGGGSAGWMTAATLIKQFPNKDISLIESKDIATVGVGESTIGGIKAWTKYIGIDDKEFFKATDATYKLSIRFQDFFNKGDGGFHYPFGRPIFPDKSLGYIDWLVKKYLYPDTPRNDFATCFWPQMAMVNNNKLFNDPKYPFNFFNDTAYHFDATKFGLFLRDKYCIPKGVKHIVEDIKSIQKNETGVLSLNNRYKADLFFDCTGFKSLLLDKTLEEPFISYSDILPNNSAWATRIPYADKKTELNAYTNCTAIQNGWVWSIPLWSRRGSGYVYSDKYVSDSDALNEFKEHLGRDDLEFKKIKMRVGITNRIWVKNVVAIGLAAGFIEPLESNGLFTVHEFLLRFIRNTQRSTVTQWDRDNFNYQCKKMFRDFAEFVAMHYALSNRSDTAYWKAVTNRSYEKSMTNLKPVLQDGFLSVAAHRDNFTVADLRDGFVPVSFGFEWYGTEVDTMKYYQGLSESEFIKQYRHLLVNLEKQKFDWNNYVLNKESFYDYHLQNFYEPSK